MSEGLRARICGGGWRIKGVVDSIGKSNAILYLFAFVWSRKYVGFHF